MGEYGDATAVGRGGRLEQVRDGIDGNLEFKDAEFEDESERKDSTQAQRPLTAFPRVVTGHTQG